MIEAVNSVVANASLLRTQSEQGSEQRSEPVVSIETSGNELPQAPFVSPYISVNTQYNTAVLQIRDSDTGDVVNQFPSEETLASRQIQQTIEINSETVSVESADSTETSESGSLGAISVSVPQAVEISVSTPNTAPSNGIPNVAQAQLASAALNAGAQTGQTVTTNVSVTA